MKKQYEKYIVSFWILIITPIVLIVLMFGLISKGYLGFMPSFKDLENPDNQIASQVYSEDNVNMGNYFIKNRTYINFNELSSNAVNALIATEDFRFEHHAGIDGYALLRVAYGLITGSHKGGGSTITQQLAKNLFPRDTTPYNSKLRKSIHLATTKFREWVTAIKLERNYTKEEILVMYLNTVYFGYQSYGIKLAAKTFFNTTPQKLTVNQAATLIGMLKAPSYYNPIRHPKRAQLRRNVVLHQMNKYNFISDNVYDSLKQEPINAVFKIQDHNIGIATYLREYLRIKLNRPNPFKLKYKSEERFKEDSILWVTDPLYGWCKKNFKPNGDRYNLYTDGLIIHTTINSKMQKYAEEAVNEHLRNNLQKAFDSEKKYSSTAPFSKDLKQEEVKHIIKNSIRRSERYRILRKQGLSDEMINENFRKPINMTVFSYHGEIDTTLSPLYSILYYKHFLNSGLMSIDPRTGYVKAYVGGINFKHFKFDHVSSGKRQVGSTFKPFLYTLAMQEGYSPCYKVPNVPVTFTLPSGETWTPESVGPVRLKGKSVSLKTGLAFSINNISAWLMQQFKPKAVIDITRLMGVKSFIPEVPSICLGSADLSLYEMVGAYGTFANKGIHTEPLFVTRIEDRNGNVLAKFKPKRNEAISENAAFLMLNLMEGVADYGTSIRLRLTYNITAQIAAKTGTTNNQSDGWFMGTTPKLETGIWTGGEDRSIHFDGIHLGQGANMALPIWALFMKKVYADTTLGITQEDLFDPPVNFYMNLDCNDSNSDNVVNKDSDEFFN